jgi:protein TonB
MTRRLSAWLLASLAAHLVLVVAVLAVLRLVPAPVLFVDLVHDLLTGVETPGAGTTGRGAARGGDGMTAARRASGPDDAHRAGGAAGRRPDTPAASGPAVAGARPAPTSSSEPAAAPSSKTTAPSAATPPATPAPPSSASASSTAASPSVALTAPAGSAAPGSAIEITPVTPSSVEGEPGHRATGAAREGAGRGAAASASVGAAGDGQSSGGGTARTGGGDGGPLVLGLPGGGDGGGEYTGYLLLLRRRIAETLVFPALARRRGLSGTAHVELEIQPSGAISQVTLLASSSHRVLDEAALDAVHDVGRVPFPPGVPPRHLRVQLPVVFDLR